MKSIPVEKFKAQCLALLAEVAESNEIVVVTKYGKPLVGIVPIDDPGYEQPSPLKGSIVFEKDIVSPTEIEWNANK